MGRSISMALAGLWFVTLLSAGSAIAPAMRCNGHDMPCCPRSGGDRARCAPVQCVEQAFQKSETRDAVEPSLFCRAAGPAEHLDQPSPRLTHRLLLGLQYRDSVFRLKDDLRI